MGAELRRSVVLACAGLLAGFALVVTLYAAGTFFKRGLGSPAGLGAPAGPGLPEAPAAPSDATAPRRPGEGAEPAGKPRAALESRPGSGQGPTVPPGSETPSFDIIRIEPNGEAVIAGRAAPNTTVELLRDSVPIARALVDPSGQFALVPEALPTGSSEITLRVVGAGGEVRLSRDRVAVVVAPGRDTKPLIALTSPDKPTIVLSQPDPVTAGAEAGSNGRLATSMPDDAPGASKSGSVPSAGQARVERPGTRGGTKPAEAAGPEKAAPVKIVSVEAEEGGKLYVTSRAQPGATVRLYLNDALVAPGSAGPDGRVAFTIGRGVLPGDYRVRVDQVDSVSGKVKARSEVAFAMPAGVVKPPAKGAQIPAAVPGTPAAPNRPATIARMDTPRTPVPLPPAAASRSASAAGEPSAAPGAAAMAPRSAGPETPPAASETDRTVFVPEIGTARIIRGDSLWQISRRIYGKGTRYTVIYDANQPQIRNPDRIYPGQIFVLPSDGTAVATQEGPRG